MERTHRPRYFVVSPRHTLARPVGMRMPRLACERCRDLRRQNFPRHLGLAESIHIPRECRYADFSKSFIAVGFAAFPSLKPTITAQSQS